MTDEQMGPRDPLMRPGGEGLVRTLPVLGVRADFQVDDPALLEIVDAWFGAWASLPEGPGLRQARTVRVGVHRHDDHPGDRGRPEVRYRMPDPDTLLLGTPGSVGMADRRRGTAGVYATDSLLAEADHFGYGVLSAVTLFLVTAVDRFPVHAAALRGAGGAGVLLHGPSGSGKSTLCAVAARRGLRVVAEDVVYVQLAPELRVWGLPGPIHVPADSLRFLPGTTPAGRRIRAGGREKMVLHPPASDPVPPTLTRPPAVCLVERSPGPAVLEAVAPGDVLQAIGEPREPGFDLSAGRMGPVAAALVAGGAWRLRTGSDPHAAVDLLEGLLAGSTSATASRRSPR